MIKIEEIEKSLKNLKSLNVQRKIELQCGLFNVAEE